MEREGFVFYRSFYDAIKNMDDKLCASCLKAICEYGLNGIEQAEDPVSAAILIMAKPTIDKNNQRYENGKKGGRPRNQTEPSQNQNQTKIEKTQPTETDTDTVTDTVTENSVDRAKKPHKTFSPPSLEEVQAYCLERKNHVNAERFIDYYTANGWKVGKNAMKDWKAAVRTWEKQTVAIRSGQKGAFENAEFKGTTESGTKYNGIEL